MRVIRDGDLEAQGLSHIPCPSIYWSGIFARSITAYEITVADLQQALERQSLMQPLKIYGASGSTVAPAAIR